MAVGFSEWGGGCGEREREGEGQTSVLRGQGPAHRSLGRVRLRVGTLAGFGDGLTRQAMSMSAQLHVLIGAARGPRRPTAAAPEGDKSRSQPGTGRPNGRSAKNAFQKVKKKPPPPEDLDEVTNLRIRVNFHKENREILPNLRRLTHKSVEVMSRFLVQTASRTQESTITWKTWEKFQKPP